MVLTPSNEPFLRLSLGRLCLAVVLTFAAQLALHESARANQPRPVAVIRSYPEWLAGSYAQASGAYLTTYRWFVDGVQQSGTSSTFTYAFTTTGTVAIGLEVRDSYGTWSYRKTVTVEVAPTPRRYYCITDHLGSIRVVINEANKVVACSDYYPFGLEMPRRSLAGDDATMEGFTGHDLDGETGLTLLPNKDGYSIKSCDDYKHIHEEVVPPTSG